MPLQTRDTPNMDIRAIMAGLAFALIWSSAFTSARIIVAEAPPMLSLALRFLISGMIGVALAFAMGQRIRLTAGQWRSILIFGLCQNAIYLGLNFIAMQTVEASLASIIASSMPLLVALIGWLVLSQRLQIQGVAGLCVGFIGVAIIMGARVSGGADLYGIGLCAVAALSLAVATLTVKGASSSGNLLMVVGLQMLVGAAALAIPGVLLETWQVTWTPRLTAAFAYTTIFPGLVATVLWFWLVARIGAVKAATFHFLNPFFGVLVAAVLLGEGLGIFDYIGVVVITLGIWAVQTSRNVAQ